MTYHGIANNRPTLSLQGRIQKYGLRVREGVGSRPLLSPLLEHRCTTTNLPLCNDTIIVLKIIMLHSVSVITNFATPKRDKTTDRQTKNITLFCLARSDTVSKRLLPFFSIWYGSPIILVFQVLNSFAKFRQGRPPLGAFNGVRRVVYKCGLAVYKFRDFLSTNGVIMFSPREQNYPTHAKFILAAAGPPPRVAYASSPWDPVENSLLLLCVRRWRAIG